MAKKKSTKPNDQDQAADRSIPEQSEPSEPKLEETVRSETTRLDEQLDATIDHEQIEDAKSNEDLDQTIDQDQIEPTANQDQLEQTLDQSQLDQTVEVDQPDSSSSQDVSVYQGKSSPEVGSDIDKTVSGSQQDSTIFVSRGTMGQQDDEDTSILQTSDIGQTVNPRELSDGDVTLWNSAVGESNQSFEIDSGLIGDSYSERQFERLRRVDVAKLKSDTETNFDYRLVRKLGQGGMGDVFVARQGSLDRLLALKLIKPLSDRKRDELEKTGRLDTVEEERRQQFLSEAIVTGDLDHPNIVPIHDVGLTSDNQLFYSMKRVVGTPWSEVINDRSRDENLEILLKASDAVGFAHTRGVVHRDIKPENIMLGDFGVVMVMDWGLALLTSEHERQESINATSGLGGTPAFMAPEMAMGPIDEIHAASDIYLLGATLFMIITGKPPHYAKNITQCLQAVRSNKIREIPPEAEGELMDIALRAMATDPADRYPDVESFQSAIREYRSHAESISLAANAYDDLRIGTESRSYADLSRARFRFEESLQSWSGNEKAQRGLAETKIVHADAAYTSGDYDLGLSLLDDQNPEHQPIIEKLREAIQERDSRATRLALLRKVAVAMLAFIIVGGSAALYSINSQRQLALSAHQQEIVERKRAEDAKAQEAEARKDAELARIEAEDQQAIAEVAEGRANENAAIAKVERDNAEQQRKLAEAAQQEAVQERDEAQKARAAAVAAQELANYEEYVSKIGLAKARLDRNEVDGAKQILLELKASEPQAANSWEWRWLWRQANQARSVQSTGSAVIDQSIRGRHGIVALSNGLVKRFGIDDQGKLNLVRPVTLDAKQIAKPTSVAITADGDQIAIGMRDGQILLVDEDSTRRLNRHQSIVSDLHFSADGLLFSASHDKTIRVWDPESGRELTANNACWHLSPVRQIAIVGQGSTQKLAAATSDDSSGRVALWNVRTSLPSPEQTSRSKSSITFDSAGVFDQHTERITTVAMSADGQRIASGDAGGNVFVWNPDDVRVTDYAGALGDAIAVIDDQAKPLIDREPERVEVEFSALVDDTALETSLVSTAPSTTPEVGAHDDVIRSIRFNAQGSAILTAADDNTLKLWNGTDPQLGQTLRGHGGWVVGADFVTDSDDLVVSASNDATVRTWDLKTYTGSFVANRTSPPASGNQQTDAHRDELTFAALSPDRNHLITTSRDHTARVMQIDPQSLTFKEIARLEDELLEEGSEFVAMSMQCDQDHRRLYVGSADATIQIWDLDLGVEIGRATGTGLNASFALSDDGTLMLTGSSSPQAKAILWKLDPNGDSAPRVLHRVNGHEQAVTAFAISADASQFFTADREGRGFLWDVKQGSPIGPPIDTVRGFRINTAALSPDGSELFLGADDQQLTTIDLASRTVVGRLNHAGVVTSLALSRDGGRALTISQQSNRSGMSTFAMMWDLESERGEILDRVDSSNRRNGRRITSARFDRTGNLATVSQAATAESSARVRIWDLSADIARGRFVRNQPAASNRDRRSNQTFQLPAVLGTAQIALPIAERTLLTMNKNGVFRWNMTNRRLVKSYRPHASLTEASFSFDGKRVVTASRSIKIWDPLTGQALGKIESPHKGPVRTVQFAQTPIGDTQYVFATGGDDQFVRVWSWNDETKATTKLYEYQVSSVPRRVRFAPNGRQLLIVGDQGLVRLQSLADPKGHVSFETSDTLNLTSGAFSADGDLIVVGGDDSQARLWNVPQPGDQPNDPIILSGHADAVTDVKIIGQAESTMRVLTGSADDTARVWDPRLESETNRGRELISLRRHNTDIMAVDATGEGDLMMTASRDGSVMLWPANPE